MINSFQAARRQLCKHEDLHNREQSASCGVTLVQLGTNPVLPASFDDSPEWEVADTTEFQVILSSRLFPNEGDWSDFIADSRKSVVHKSRQLDASRTQDAVEFRGWKTSLRPRLTTPPYRP